MRGSKPPVPAPRLSQERGLSPERPPLPARPKKERPAPQASQISESNQLETLRDFALRKNFTESEFEEALSRTISRDDTNDFLSQLISVRAERGVETLSTQRTPPRSRISTINSQSGLRNIVIDGSNVAMT